MTKNDKVRASRDGDQFHYLWAAHRCLRLLSSESRLIAITIEGASNDEGIEKDGHPTNEEVIDLAEYYGSEIINESDKIVYCQLKHSTLHCDEEWNPSGLSKTLQKFSSLYKFLQSKIDIQTVNNRISFEFITNRPIQEKIIQTVKEISSESKVEYEDIYIKLLKCTGLTKPELIGFCSCLILKGNQSNYLSLRKNLEFEIRNYLPGQNASAALRLKELVTQKALSENESTPSITKVDVLKAMGVTEDELLPAQSMIQAIENGINRECEQIIAGQILATNGPLIIHGEGGTGKTILSQRIGMHLPEGSIAIVYDCFGNGSYRQPSQLRHQHEVALTQISNELSGYGLCYPLLPSPKASNVNYLNAFLKRLEHSITLLQDVEGTQAKICIIVDAADNAEMAAREYQHGHSFIRDLMQEKLPNGAILIALCRTHRIELLNPPPRIKKIKIPLFNIQETQELLLKHFPDATEIDIATFHRKTSQNPRVQVKIIESFKGNNLQDVLNSLSEKSLSSDEQIAALLEKAIEKIIYEAPDAEKAKINLICNAIAVFRPLVDIEVLGKVSDSPSSLIRDLIAELHQYLILTGDTIQFKDEPTETWFKNYFFPSTEILKRFSETLKELASSSNYAASILPLIMFQADLMDDLIEIALSKSSLPTNEPAARRRIELSRLQYALLACLRCKRFSDAAKLALKLGTETSADELQYNIIKENADLFATFCSRDTILEYVSDRKKLTGEWLGSNYIYEAALLSCINQFHGEAQNKIRNSYYWILSSRKDDNKVEHITIKKVVELSIAILNVAKTENCAEELLNGIHIPTIMPDVK